MIITDDESAVKQTDPIKQDITGKLTCAYGHFLVQTTGMFERKFSSINACQKLIPYIKKEDV